MESGEPSDVPLALMRCAWSAVARPLPLRCVVLWVARNLSRGRELPPATWFSLAATTTNTDRRTRVGGGTASGRTSHALESGEPRDVPLPLFGRAWSAVARPPPRCAGAMRGGFYNTGPCVPVGVWPVPHAKAWCLGFGPCQGLGFGVWPVPGPGVWGFCESPNLEGGAHSAVDKAPVFRCFGPGSSPATKMA